ncbi:LytTR family DNA-binding domain-containing protein [Cytobacillus sp. IB215665]|uniref:LytR/AlgR family response regulator transcription factor n=1 Tax=Cytobacillus sp. IB215665 TaxID=3097357 RepID=UPI002A14871D|nr:LytTR family DNA-binding domain-containing protein [Cytobacillus sp. IB215665]MDX8365689.1 LytTR family DNA-binding domain-containing protein [Cytobacillus sp. IB215665]
MVKVGLVDDHKYDLEKLEALLRKEEMFSIHFSTTDSEEAYEFIKKNEIDLLITDIEMPKLSGYELADFIQTYALDIKVIFLTGHSGYAVHAFELDVLDYILKPYSKDRLMKGMNRYKRHMAPTKDEGKLVLKQKSEMNFIDKKNILFIERTGRSSKLVTIDGEFETYQSLSDLEDQLNNRNFIRSHRSFIINLHYVKNFSIYAKNSFSISFQHTNQTAIITKSKLEYVQENYF